MSVALLNGKVLVSACLLGDAVRHDGRHKRLDHEILRRWVEAGRVVAICPEVAGGLPVPRPAAEIESGAGGAAVLDGRAKVRDLHGTDVTAAFVAGAQRALQLAIESGARVAVLKQRSPSCGSRESYDGSFSGLRVTQPGVTAALLAAHGIAVFGEEQIAEAERMLAAT